MEMVDDSAMQDVYAQFPGIYIREEGNGFTASGSFRRSALYFPSEYM